MHQIILLYAYSPVFLMIFFSSMAPDTESYLSSRELTLIEDTPDHAEFGTRTNEQHYMLQHRGHSRT